MTCLRLYFWGSTNESPVSDSVGGCLSRRKFSDLICFLLLKNKLLFVFPGNVLQLPINVYFENCTFLYNVPLDNLNGLTQTKRESLLTTSQTFASGVGNDANSQSTIMSLTMKFNSWADRREPLEDYF